MARFLDNIGLAYFWEKIKAWIPFLSRKTQSIPFGQVDSTSTSTVFTATVDGITELRDGVCCYIRNGVVTSATGCTLNINGLGAKPMYYTTSSTGRVTSHFNINYTWLFVYNSTRIDGGCWDSYWGYNSEYNLSQNYIYIGRINVGDYPTSAYSLGAFDVNGKWTPFVTTATTSTGKSLVQSVFPIGAKIYRDSAYRSNNTSYNDVYLYTTLSNSDLRYSSVNHNQAIFPNYNFNRVFMPVIVNAQDNTFTLTTQTTSGYNNNFTNERNLNPNNFYIEIGFNSGNTTSYYFTLICENNLYYYDGKSLIDYHLYKTQLVNADLSNKADKVVGATSGNFAGLDSTGNLTDSGYKPSDFITQHQHIPEYTIEKLTQAETSYSASYVLKKDNVQVGATINIPKDMVVSSGEVKTVTTANVPYQGAQVGDKYIDLTIANTSQNHIYIPVKDLVDVYVAGNGIRISDNNYISVVVDSNNANGLGVGGSGLALYHVTPSVNGSGGSDGAMLATDKEKLDGIEAGAEENVIETVKVSGTALQVTDKAVNIVTETAYDPTTNKIATMSDVTGATPNVGHLKTDNSASLTPSASESFTGDISLHTVAKTGSYKDLNDQPTIPSAGDFVTSLGTSGNNVTWTKNGVTNNLTVPYATNAGTAAKLGSSTIGASNRPIYLNAGVPAVTDPGEAFLSWGGRNFSASYGCIDAAMVPELGACRTMFAKAAGIVIEYSVDGGATWLDYGATNVEKVGLFSSGKGFTIGKATKETASAANMLRVTLHTSAAGLYTSLNKFVIFVSTNGSTGTYCTIRCRTQQNYEDNIDTWNILANQVSVNGWPGYNVINFPSTTTYGNTKSTHHGEWQFIFGCTGHNSASYAGLNVSKIFGFGGVGWSTPSTMAKTGHLYSFDASQNAFFPADVTASKFIKSGGTSSQFLKADGSVDSNTYATTSQLPSLPLSIANGGTGKTTAEAAANALIGGLPTWTAEPSDNVYLIRRDTGGSLSFGQVKFSTVWNYIKSKIASVLGIGGSNGVPTAPTAAVGTNTTQIATTAFVGSATSGLAIDDEVVHKAGAETITGEKTFEANVNLEVLPTSNNHATNKLYVDATIQEAIEGIEGNFTTVSAKIGEYAIFAHALVAFASKSPLSSDAKQMELTPFTQTGGTSSKTPIVNTWFPIGCKIYYNNEDEAGPSGQGVVAQKKLYLTHKNVDARYSAITGSNVSLGYGFNNTVYLRVMVEDGYWSPYYKSGETNEIIVSANQLVTNNYYIYLGKTVGSSVSDVYTFELEDNNQLYYYNGTDLIDYATRISDIGSSSVLPSGGTTGQVLAKASNADNDVEWINQSAGVTDYDDLDDQPQINGVTLSGNKTSSQLGLQSELTFDNTPTANSNNPVKSGGVKTALDAKQDTLVSGTNIKTVNNTSLLGSGNIQINDGVGFQTISTQQDGTMQITLTNGDTITVDLNHVHPQYYSKVMETVMPQGGFLPDVVYSLGVLGSNTTFSLAPMVVGNVNHYYWTFSTATTAITVTWPTKLIWVNGSVPTIAANKHYEISILDSIAAYMETSIQEND